MKKLFSQWLTYGVSSLFLKLSMFVVWMLAARFLSVEEFGLLDLTIISLTMFTAIITLETSQGLARFYPTAGATKALLFSTVINFQILLLVTIVILTLVLKKNFQIIPSNFDDLFFLIYLSLPMYVISNTLINHLRWQQKHILHLATNLIQSVIIIIFMIVIYYSPDLQKVGFVISAIIFSKLIIVILLIVTNIKEYLLTINLAHLKEIISFSFPLLISTLSVHLSMYVDRFLINEYLTIAELGEYSAQIRYASVYMIATTGLMSALPTFVYSNIDNDKLRHNLRFLYTIHLTLIFTFMLINFWYGHELFKLLFGQHLPYDRNISGSLIYASMILNCYIFFPGLEIRKMTVTVLKINILAALLNVILNIVLLPKFGIGGAAFATCLSYTIAFVLRVLHSNTYVFVVGLTLVGYDVMILTLFLISQLHELYVSINMLMILFILGAVVRLYKIRHKQRLN